MAELQALPASAAPHLERFGIAPGSHARLLRLLDSEHGLERVWIFGSRARGTQRHESDIDLAVDAPGLDERGLSGLKWRIEGLELLYRIDVVWLQGALDPAFRRDIDDCRQLFWQASR